MQGEEKTNMAKEVAVQKRALIDQANKNMFLVVAGASVLLGFTLVGSIYLFKWIAFNAKVIGEKSAVIADYDESIANLPTLNATIQSLTTNADLEAVARTRDSQCDGPSETPSGVGTLRECTALRVIPDALPATRNPEALLASLNQIFKLSGTSPESLSPSDSTATSPVAGVGVIPITLSISGNSTLVNTVLGNIERSIRTFEMGSITIEWRGTDSVLLRGQANAFYSSEVAAELKTKTIKADDSVKGTKR